MENTKKLTLEELRKVKGVTQQQLAGRIGTNQPAISKIEKARSCSLRTLKKYINGLGGKLEIKAVFDGDVIELQ